MLLLCLLHEVASDKGRERAGVRELAQVTIECVRRMATVGPRLSVRVLGIGSEQGAVML